MRRERFGFGGKGGEGWSSRVLVSWEMADLVFFVVSGDWDGLGRGCDDGDLVVVAMVGGVAKSRTQQVGSEGVKAPRIEWFFSRVELTEDAVESGMPLYAAT